MRQKFITVVTFRMRILSEYLIYYLKLLQGMTEYRNESGYQHDIESIIKESIGDSVTPSRLLQSGKNSWFANLFRFSPVEGPFHELLQDNEQPHYLLNTSTGYLRRNPGESASDDELVGNPAVWIVTNRRSLYVYNSDGERTVESVSFSEIISVEYSTKPLIMTVVIGTSQSEHIIEVYKSNNFASEMSEAGTYIQNKSKQQGDYETGHFDSENFDSARSALLNQLGHLREFGKQIDKYRVAKYAVSGARKGIKKGNPHTAGIGFLLGAGFAIVTEFVNKSPVEEEVNIKADDIDPEEAAETILTWQEAGKRSEKKGIELASGAVGAAVAIDNQTGDRLVTSRLAKLDIDWVARQLHEGNTKSVSIKISSDVIDTYSSDLSTLLKEDFFDELESNQ